MTVAFIDPVLAEQVVDRVMMEEAGSSYAKEFYEEVDGSFADQRVGMAGFYVWNNVGIAFAVLHWGDPLALGLSLHCYSTDSLLEQSPATSLIRVIQETFSAL